MPPTSINRIELQLSKTLDLSLIEKGIETWVWRILASLSFQTKDGWSKSHEAILDTGAPVSILPPHIWENIERKEICSHQIVGVVPGAALPVRAADVTACLMDSSHVSQPIRFRAFLSQEPTVPLILGFDGILSKSLLHWDAAHLCGFLELLS